MDINGVAGGRVYYVGDSLREFLGYNFVSGLRTLKHKNLKTFRTKNLKKLKKYLKNPVFFPILMFAQ